MKQEVIKDFLNLPGIEGLALVDGRSRPYFCGVDHGLNFQQKQALAQGIQQVIETTPATYQFFQFQFHERLVYVHKLPRELILLVLASNELGHEAYHQSLNLLKVELQRDGASAIANFQLVAGQTAINNIHRPSSRSSSPPVPTANPNPVLSPPNQTAAPSPAKSAPQPAQVARPPRTSAETSTGSSTASPKASPPSRNGKVPPAAPAAEAILIEDFLTAVNALLHLSTDYLGKTMVTNYWKSSRPPLEWLSNFEINSSGHLVMSSSAQIDKSKPLSTEQQQWLREWVKAFIQRCARIIRDFPKLIAHGNLDHQQKKILFSQS